MPSRILITVDTDSTIRFVYTDKLKGLLEQGTAQITRASSVEPNEAGDWEADLSACGGPQKLGPFKYRTAALAAEVDWIERNILTSQERKTP